MKEVAFVVVVIGLLLVAGVYFFTEYAVSPDWLVVQNVEVTESSIELQRVSNASSSTFYSRYATYYRDGILFVTIYGRSPIRFPGDSLDPSTITIPNSYVDLREIRLRGTTEVPDRTIWTKASGSLTKKHVRPAPVDAE